MIASPEHFDAQMGRAPLPAGLVATDEGRKKKLRAAAEKIVYEGYVVDSAEVLGAVVSMRQSRATHKKK